MKAVIAAVAVLFVSVLSFGAWKVSHRSADPAPLTGDEKFYLLNGPRVLTEAKQKADQAANQTKEYAALQTARLALMATKEFKEAFAAQTKAVEAGKKSDATKESKAYTVAAAAAQEAADRTKEASALKSLQSAYNKSTDDIFTRRKITTKAYVICAGPAVKQQDGSDLGETCKGVGESELELRKILPPKPPAPAEAKK